MGRKKKIEGDGLGDIISDVSKKAMNIFKPKLDGYNNVSRKTLEQYGNNKIIKLVLLRRPIPSMIQKALTLIVGKDSIPYDKLFHLALIATIDTGKEIIMEKAEVINISDSFDKNPPDSEKFEVDMKGKKDLTINSITEKARQKMGDTLYFGYEALGNNCQVYIYNLLKNSGLLTKLNTNFIYQDMKTVIKKTPSLIRKIAKMSTDAAAVVNKLTGGEKEEKEKKEKKENKKENKKYNKMSKKKLYEMVGELYKRHNKNICDYHKYNKLKKENLVKVCEKYIPQ